MKKIVLLLTVACIYTLCFFTSCSDKPRTNGFSNVTFSIANEKKLEHNYIDGVAFYEYEAVCNSNTKAQGNTKGFVSLFVTETYSANIGFIESGDWTFTVRAYNSHKFVLYEGVVQVYISKAEHMIAIPMALRKQGDGTLNINVTSRNSGPDAQAQLTWESYDGAVKGSTRDIQKKSDGDIDTYTADVKLAENRYKVTIELFTENATLSKVVIDVLIIKDDTVTITGTLEGKEDQGATVKPLAPQIPKGHIKLSVDKPRANKTVTATWVVDGEFEPEKVYWYMDGTEQKGKNGVEIELTLPSPGFHYLTATAVRGTESFSSELPLDLASAPVKATHGQVAFDRGETYGKYWFDEIKEHYRIDDAGDSWRCLVVMVIEADGTEQNPFFTMAGSNGSFNANPKPVDGLGKSKEATNAWIAPLGSNTGVYKDSTVWKRSSVAVALEKRQEYKKEGITWSLPTKAEADYIMRAMKSGKVKKTTFWTANEYSGSLGYLADPDKSSISATGKNTGAGLVLVRYI